MELIRGVKRRMELAELFRYTRSLRGDKAEPICEHYNIDKDTLREIEFGIGITDEFEAMMRDYVCRDTDCLKAFVEHFRSNHRVIVAMLMSFERMTDDRYVRRREFKESMDLLRQCYNSLNEYEKKYILRGFDIYMSFESNPKTLSLIFDGDASKYREAASAYFLYFMRAKTDINNLFMLYGLSERLSYRDADEQEIMRAIGTRRTGKKLSIVE